MSLTTRAAISLKLANLCPRGEPWRSTRGSRALAAALVTAVAAWMAVPACAANLVVGNEAQLSSAIGNAAVGEAITLFSIPVSWAAGSMIAWLYILTNAARVFTYVPQLIAVWRSTDGARDISLLTWGSWVVANATAVAYGTYVVHDLFFTLIAVVNLVCCAAVTVVGAQRRRVFRTGRSRCADGY